VGVFSLLQKLSEEEKEILDQNQYAPTPYHEADTAPELDHRPAEENGEDNFSPAVRALMKT
jgi:hypothetical protein